jgi:transcriptional regulator with XRE-family HTH domain
MENAGESEQRVGRRVAEVRAKLGWSQERLAQEMSRHGFGWTQSTVAKTEAASRPIRVNELTYLAVAMRVGVTELLSGPELAFDENGKIFSISLPAALALAVQLLSETRQAYFGLVERAATEQAAAFQRVQQHLAATAEQVEVLTGFVQASQERERKQGLPDGEH